MAKPAPYKPIVREPAPAKPRKATKKAASKSTPPSAPVDTPKET